MCTKIKPLVLDSLSTKNTMVAVMHSAVNSFTILLCFLYLFVELMITVNEYILFKPILSHFRNVHRKLNNIFFFIVQVLQTAEKSRASSVAPNEVDSTSVLTPLPVLSRHKALEINASIMRTGRLSSSS